MENRPPLPPRPSTTTFNPKWYDTTDSKDAHEHESRRQGQGEEQQQYHIGPFDLPPPPPPYTADPPPPTLIHNQIDDSFPRRSSVLPVPVVVPQTSHTFHGTIYRPFARAYPPTLTTIPPPDFLSFIDGLNTVWLANPYLQAAGASTSLLGFIPLLEVQLAALGVQVATEYGAIKLSQMRTQAYMRLANERLFAPRGLRVQVLKTKRLVRVLGVGDGVLELGRVEGGEEVFGDEGDDGEECKDGKREDGKGKEKEKKYDPQLRRMDALKDHVLPLMYDDDLPVADNWLKRTTDKQERWFAERQNTMLSGKRDKAAKLVAEAVEAEKELNVKMDEIEAEKEAVRARARERLQGPLGESMQGQGIVREDLEKEMKKLDRKVDKLIKEKEKRVTKKMAQSERRIQRVEKREKGIAQRVMWVVVTGDDGMPFENDLWEESDS